MSKVVFFCIPAHGHTNPMLPVASELVKSGKTISEAAADAGFNNYSTFYRAYKNFYGSAPNEKLFTN
mgnify:CR=1 FL=1